jgi:hypothetical protein
VTPRRPGRGVRETTIKKSLPERTRTADTLAEQARALVDLTDRELLALGERLDAAVRDPDLPRADRDELLYPAVAVRVTLRRRRAVAKATEARAALERAGVAA